MSAYQDLMTALASRRPDQTADQDERTVQAALAKHAHELAEQQRAWAHEEGGAPEYGSIDNVLEAADRIDPYANGAGPVRPDEEPTP